MLEMVREAERELLTYPEWSAGYKIKRRIRALMGQSVAPSDKFNWPNGLLAKGLADYYAGHKNSDEAEEILNCLKKYCDNWIQKGCKMYYLDDAFSGIALIELHQYVKDEKYRQAAEKIAQYLYQHERDGAGSFYYRPAQPSQYVFADGIGLICPFLCKYGKTYGDKQAVSLAVSQIQNFFEFAMDGRTGLPYHGYQYESRIKYGIIGWGRAVGWLMIGMAESLACMEPADAGYEEVKQAYRRLVDKVEAYQLESGFYNWQLGAKEGPIDTSATAMILYAIALSLNTGVLIRIHKSRMMRGREALWNSVKDGKIGNCLAECQGFSQYPQIYGAYPWSLGPSLSLFALTEEEQGFARHT
ncbi:MAG: glycoside hydrolase family 88 protein [Clostridium sp.]|nr:glycoside hydrolase family 88 protein [Clostridium sp.]